MVVISSDNKISVVFENAMWGVSPVYNLNSKNTYSINAYVGNYSTKMAEFNTEKEAITKRDNMISSYLDGTKVYTF